jgi:hypothetical protein
MLNIDRVFQRLTQVDKRGNIPVPELAGKSISDLRYIVFPQEIIIPAGGTFTTPVVVPAQPQQFAAGAVIIGIDADSLPDGQPSNPFLVGRERFEIQFDYTQGDKLSTAFGTASALFGRNGENQWPQKELYMPPQQNIFTSVRTRLPEQLLVTVYFGALVWRFAQ